MTLNKNVNSKYICPNITDGNIYSKNMIMMTKTVMLFCINKEKYIYVNAK